MSEEDDANALVSSDDLGAGDNDIEDDEDEELDFSPEKTPSADTPGGEAPPAPGGDVYENQPFDEAMALTDESSVSDHSDGELDNGGMMMSGAMPGGSDAMLVTNQSYDEAIDVSDASTVSPAGTGMTQHQDESSEDDKPNMMGDMHDMQKGDSESSSDSDDDDSEMGTAQGLGGMVDEEGDSTFKPIEGGYDPAEFEELDCEADVRDLFMYISRYKPHQVELESTLKPFIPEFIPAVGDIDAFIRVPRPDNSAAKEDTTGLTVLDEPAAVQTDRAALEMQLRAFTKKSGLAAQDVTSIEDAGANPAAIHKWIASVNELHTSKPQTTIAFSKPMPDIEALMQVWPSEFEEMLNNVPLPPANLDMSVEDYAKVCCSLLDIPVQDNLIHSLHTMCMLYSEFKGNQHFGVMQGNEPSPMQGMAMGNGMH